MTRGEKSVEEVDAEIDALLAKIPSKHRNNHHYASNRRPSDWRCEPVTIAVASLLITAVGVLLYLSMSPKPFWAFKELEGYWAVEPQGPAARKAVVDALDEDAHITCRVPELVRGLESPLSAPSLDDDSNNDASSVQTTRTVTDSDKIVGALPAAECTMSWGPFQLATTVVFDSLRANSALWTWTGMCVDDKNIALSGEAAIHNKDVCSITIHRKHMILSVVRGRAAHSYLLTRSDQHNNHRRGGGGSPSPSTWETFWQDKGRFMFMILVSVVVLKGFQHVLSPNKKNAAQRIREQKFRRAAAAAAEAKQTLMD